MDNDDTRTTFIIGLAIGAVIGTAATLLFAPQSGKEMREEISYQGVEIRARAEDLGETVKSQSHDALRSQRNRWQLAMDAAREAAEAKREELLKKYEDARSEGKNSPLDESAPDRY